MRPNDAIRRLADYPAGSEERELLDYVLELEAKLRDVAEYLAPLPKYLLTAETAAVAGQVVAIITRAGGIPAKADPAPADRAPNRFFFER